MNHNLIVKLFGLTASIIFITGFIMFGFGYGYIEQFTDYSKTIMYPCGLNITIDSLSKHDSLLWQTYIYKIAIKGITNLMGGCILVMIGILMLNAKIEKPKAPDKIKKYGHIYLKTAQK